MHNTVIQNKVNVPSEDHSPLPTEHQIPRTSHSCQKMESDLYVLIYLHTFEGVPISQEALQMSRRSCQPSIYELLFVLRFASCGHYLVMW